MQGPVKRELESCNLCRHLNLDCLATCTHPDCHHGALLPLQLHRGWVLTPVWCPARGSEPAVEKPACSWSPILFWAIMLLLTLAAIGFHEFAPLFMR